MCNCALGIPHNAWLGAFDLPTPNLAVMKISVIIPAYNEELALPKTLKRIGETLSIVACPSEIIVVDNDSQDKTKEVAASFGAAVCLEKEHNISQVRNTGAENSTGDVLIFIDADTLVPDTLFRKIAAVMEDEKCFGGAVAVGYVDFERKWMRFLTSHKPYLGLTRMELEQAGCLVSEREKVFAEFATRARQSFNVLDGKS